MKSDNSAPCIRAIATGTAQQQTFGNHRIQHGRHDPPILPRRMMPGQQDSHGQQRQQKILAEAQQVQKLPEPDIRPVTHGLRAEPEHMPPS